MNSGYIKLYRAILNNVIWDENPETFKITCFILLNACYKETKKAINKKKVIFLQPGQILISVRNLAKKTKISYQKTRTAIEFLETSEFLTQESTQKLTLITVNNWASYQSGEDNLTQESTQSQRNANAVTKALQISEEPIQQNLLSVVDKPENPCGSKQRSKEGKEDKENTNIHSVKQPSESIPYQAIVDLFNTETSAFAKVSVLNESRKRLIKARWSSSNTYKVLDFWKDYNFC